MGILVSSLRIFYMDIDYIHHYPSSHLRTLFYSPNSVVFSLSLCLSASLCLSLLNSSSPAMLTKYPWIYDFLWESDLYSRSTNLSKTLLFSSQHLSITNECSYIPVFSLLRFGWFEFTQVLCMLSQPLRIHTCNFYCVQ